MRRNKTDIFTSWNKVAQDLLVGRTIKRVAYMDEQSAKDSGFFNSTVCIVLDNDLVLFAQSDDEGNDAGALVCLDNKTGRETLLPQIRIA